MQFRRIFPVAAPRTCFVLLASVPELFGCATFAFTRKLDLEQDAFAVCARVLYGPAGCIPASCCSSTVAACQHIASCRGLLRSIRPMSKTRVSTGRRRTAQAAVQREALLDTRAGNHAAYVASCSSANRASARTAAPRIADGFAVFSQGRSVRGPRRYVFARACLRPSQPVSGCTRSMCARSFAARIRSIKKRSGQNWTIHAP